MAARRSGRGRADARCIVRRPDPAVSATVAGAPASSPGVTAQRRQVLVELQRADRRGVAELQVVPRPPRADAFVVEVLVVPDDRTVNLLDASGPQRRRPLVEDGPWRAPRAC